MLNSKKFEVIALNPSTTHETASERYGKFRFSWLLRVAGTRFSTDLVGKPDHKTLQAVA